MPRFFHDIYLFGDPIGASIWRREHQDEHTQFVQTFLAQTPPLDVTDYDLDSWEDNQRFVAYWLTAHESVHEELRSFTGVSGVNLADVNLFKIDEFYEWIDVHRAEHVLIRQALGIL